MADTPKQQRLSALDIAQQSSSNAPAAQEDNRTDGVVLVDEERQKPSLSATPEELKKLLDVIENEIMPETERGVAAGNKVFGAAILKPDLTCDLASTNTETDCPLFHGEVKCIYDWSKEIPAEERGPRAQKSVFLATHEPCCMCVASICWSGFPKIYYFLPYATTTAQGIPHDINTMHELWGVNSYRKRNKYFASACIQEMIDELDDGDVKTALQTQSKSLLKRYDELARKYHAEKTKNNRNSLVLG